MLFIFIYAYVSPQLTLHSWSQKPCPWTPLPLTTPSPLGLFLFLDGFHTCMFYMSQRPVTPDRLCKAGMDVLTPHPLSAQMVSRATRVPSQRPLTSVVTLVCLSLLSMYYFLCVLQLMTEVRNMALWSVEWFPISCFIGASHCPGRQQKQMVLTHFTDGETVT